MKKKILVLMLASMLAASCVACGSKSSDKKDELSSAATEILSETETETEQLEEQDITADALTPLADAGVITGVKDITVAEGTDVNLNDLVYADKNIVKSVDIDDSKVDYSKAGTYEVIYTITFDGDKFRDYVKDNNIDVNFDTDGNTIVVKTTVTVTVATKEDADKAIASGNTDVVTPETKESVAESNKAKANDNAVASKPAEKPAKKPAGNSNDNNGNAGNNSNSGDNDNHNGNTNGNNGGNNVNHNGNTEKPHVHKYNSGVVTKAPTCTETGIKTYTCVNGDDSYTETIPALGHDYVTRTETVTVKEAWDEDMYEGFYICNGCGEQFTNTTNACIHILAVPNDKCGSYYEEDVKVNTIHHPAETETRTYKVCSRCGDTVK
jgi:outer membrane murein-binding lipoprotein Lpp